MKEEVSVPDVECGVVKCQAVRSEKYTEATMGRPDKVLWTFS